MAELIITTTVPNAPIEANLNELEAFVSTSIAKYTGAFYTDDQMKLAKKDRANLRRLKEDIDSKRKELKAAWNAPYLAFEGQLKAIMGKIDEPVALIDSQIKDYEQHLQDTRKEALLAVFKKFNTLGDLVAFDSLVTPEMLKQSTSDAKATRLFTDKLEQIQADIAKLESVINTQNRTACLDHYFKTYNLADTLLLDMRLTQEARKQAQVLGEVPQDTVQVPEQEDPTDDLFAGIPMTQERPQLYHIALSATVAQMDAVRRFCKENQIKIKEFF